MWPKRKQGQVLDPADHPYAGYTRAQLERELERLETQAEVLTCRNVAQHLADVGALLRELQLRLKDLRT